MVSLVYAPKPVPQTLSSFLSIEFADAQTLQTGRGYSFKVHVFNGTNGMPVGEGATCYLHLYNASENHLVELNTSTVSHKYDYEISVGAGNFTDPGIYPFVFQCNTSSAGGYYSSYLEVTNSGMPFETNSNGFMLVILLPLLFYGLLLFGSTQMGDEHQVLKIFIFLLAPVFFWASMHFALITIAQVYNLPALQEFIADTVYWIALICGVVLTYFIIYLFYKLVKIANQEKEELKY